MNGSSSHASREAMIRDHLRPRGIEDQRVLQALRAVPREAFVPEEMNDRAYEDCALPIDCQQTISQPYIVALMTQALDLHGDEKVLEVGTGSGYQAAVLSQLAAQVVTIERHAELARKAARVLTDLGCDNVLPVVGDGSLGWPQEAPYERIIVTAGAAQAPQALMEQLAEGGVLVMPVGPAERQMLTVHRKVGERVQTIDLCPCRFVPLLGEGLRDEG